MSKTKKIYEVKNSGFFYSTYFAWLILNTPEEYKEIIASNWKFDDVPCSNGNLVKILFTAEHEYEDKELACVQDIVTDRVYIIDSSALELKEEKEKSLLDRLRKDELNFLQGLATGKIHCNTRECRNCILSYFPETTCENLAKDLLEKLK